MESAEAERRVILTCDRVFVRARHSDFTYFVRAERKQEQLEEVRDTTAVQSPSILSACHRGCRRVDPQWLFHQLL